MRTTLSVTLIVFISKAVGFVRDIVQARYFGTSLINDAYGNAYSFYYIPIMLLTSCITSTMVPLYLDADKVGGRKLADRFASNCINLFAVIAVGLAVIMFALADPLTHLFFGKLPPEGIKMTIEMTRIMMPSLIFVTVSIVQASIMNAREKYIVGQLSGFPYSLLTILAAVLFSARYGIYAIAWATAIAGLVQMLIVIPFQRGVFRYRIRLDIRDSRIKRMLMLAVPSMASMAVNEVNHIIDRSFANGLNPGDPSALGFAYKLITFVLGVVIVPITTVMFSRMSMRAAQRDLKSVSEIVMQCIEVIMMVLLPVMVLGIVFSLDAVKLVFLGGKFTMESAFNTAWLLSMYLLGLVFFGLRDLFNRGFHSLQNTRIPLYISILSVALNVAMKALFSRYMGAGGLALATSISSMVGVAALFVLLRRKLGGMPVRSTAIELGKMVFAALICMALGMELNRFVPEAAGKLQMLMRLVVCCLPCLLVYVVALIAMKTKQLAFFGRLLKR